MELNLVSAAKIRENKEVISQKAKNTQKAKDELKKLIEELELDVIESSDSFRLRSNNNNAIRLIEYEMQGKCKFNELHSNIEVEEDGEFVQMTDYSISKIFVYISKKYKDVSFDKKTISSVIETLALQNSYNPLKDKIINLRWDGEKRVETYFIELLGVEDSRYTRNATRKHMLAMITRLFSTQAVKYDNCIILTGAQGIGKTLSLSRLAFSDYHEAGVSLASLENKDTLLKIEKKAIVEFSELKGLNKAETESVKSFISSECDTIRRPYSRAKERIFKRCVFYATTNECEFLKDVTGNRRFIVFQCDKEKQTRRAWEQDDTYFEQIWAELYQLYLTSSESLFLDYEDVKTQEELHKDYIDYDEDQFELNDFIKTHYLDGQRIPLAKVMKDCFNLDYTQDGYKKRAFQIKRMCQRCEYLSDYKKRARVDGRIYQSVFSVVNPENNPFK